MDPHQIIQQKLDRRKSDGSLRILKPQSQLTDFCSNDYLGFARSATLQQMIDNEVQKFMPIRNGSTGSRLLAGNTDYAEQLEHHIASYHNSEAGLIFNSGYDANVGLFSSLPQRGDTVIHDELIHASIIDGIRLSNAQRYSFKHNDLNNLESQIIKAKGICYVAVESVYSMDGDMAPLNELVALCEKYGASLIVDEAHAVGVFHKGLVNQLGLENRIFARVITFGKALGCHGAIVVGSPLLREYLINFSRSFIYTTAAPFHQLVAINMAYELLKSSQAVVSQLHDKINLYQHQITNQHSASHSAIQTIRLNSNEKALNTAMQLQMAGLDVRAILSPTVPAGTERIRICLHAFNSDTDILALTHHINTITNEH